MRVLVCDPLSPRALEYLQKNNLDPVYNPKITPEELLNSAGKYEMLIVKSRTKITRDIIAKGDRLKAIGRIGTGVDNIDVEECNKRKITVVNSPRANSQSVAELTLALMITLLRNLDAAFVSMKKGEWIKSKLMGSELSGKTIGIVGYGVIGKRIEELVKLFGCRILVYSKSYKNSTLDDLFSKSDLITIHLALNQATRKLINIKLLSQMNKNAYLINTSRGEIIDEDDLYKVLSEEKIKGAALDVFWEEPLAADSRWRKLSNVIITPHLGASTVEAQERAGISVAEDLVRISKGEEPTAKFK